VDGHGAPAPGRRRPRRKATLALVQRAAGAVVGAQLWAVVGCADPATRPPPARAAAEQGELDAGRAGVQGQYGAVHGVALDATGGAWCWKRKSTTLPRTARTTPVSGGGARPLTRADLRRPGVAWGGRRPPPDRWRGNSP